MNKELTPLKAFIKIKEGSCKGKYQKYCDIVETALKDYEELTSKPAILCGRTHGSSQALIDYICKNYKEVKITNLVDEKKLKAFEIVKKKRVNVHLLILSDSLEKYNFNLLPYRKLTQKEFDFLKEILK